MISSTDWPLIACSRPWDFAHSGGSASNLMYLLWVCDHGHSIKLRNFSSMCSSKRFTKEISTTEYFHYVWRMRVPFYYITIGRPKTTKVILTCPHHGPVIPIPHHLYADSVVAGALVEICLIIQQELDIT